MRRKKGAERYELRTLVKGGPVGVDYISCSPYRIPIAKLVAAQTAIQARSDGSQAEIPSAETS